MSHYYINDPKLKSNKKIIGYNYLNEEISLVTDHGVFSKDKIDFGSNLLLNSLGEVEFQEALDIGCGYGVMGISLAKKYKNSIVHLTDINKRALELAEENAKLNKLENIKIYESNAYDNITTKFDLILSNPPIRAGKDIVHAIVLGSINHLTLTGSIYVVIQKKQGALSLIRKLEEIFACVKVINKKAGYYIIKANN